MQISVYGNIWKATMWHYKCVNVTVKETASQNSNGSGLDMVADINNSDVETLGEREMARNGQHYDAKLLCTVSNSDVGKFGERDGQEWATLRCKITLYGFQ